MKGKIIGPIVSFILIVGVAIGVLIAVHKKSSDSKVTSHENTTVRTLCQNTEDKKLCHHTLTSANASSLDPKVYIEAAVKAATESVIKALNMSDRLTVEYGGKDKGVNMALADCKDLLESAMDSLELSTNFVRDNNIQSVNTQSPDFRNWLSAVISYHQACLDGFDSDKDGEKIVMEQLNQQSFDMITKITGITLDIVADLPNTLQQFNLGLNMKPAAASRRLLGNVEVDSEDYPTWFSASNRKLLAKMEETGWTASVKPNIVVAKDGSGQFKTIKEAINSYPAGFKGRYYIYVKAGIYDAEYIIVPINAVNIVMYGDGPASTIVTGRKNYAEGVTTMQTASFANNANGFIARSIGFQNTAGPGGQQAVAFRNQGDMSAFFDCHFHGYQDTLFAQSNRQFYRNCEISGTVDFIFGASSTLIQKSRIIVRKPNENQSNTVTADGTSKKTMNTGIVLQNSEILPEAELFPIRFKVKSFLGRPWKAYSRTVVMESTIGDLICREGWCPWQGTEHLDTLYYAEYANTGPGAPVDKRIKWKGYRGLISREEAAQFTAGQFLKAGPNASAEQWLNPLGVPFDLGFTKA